MKTKDEKRTLRRVSRYFADLQGATAGLRPEPTPLPVWRQRADTTPRHGVGIFVDYNVDFRRSYLTEAQREHWRGSSFRNLDTVIIAVGDGLKADCLRNYNALCGILLTESDEQSLKQEEQADSTIVVVKLKTLQSAGIDITDATTVESCVEQVQIAFGFIEEETVELKKKFKPSEIALELLNLTNHLIIIMDNGTFYLKKDRGYIQFMPNFKRPGSTYVANELGVYISSLVAHALADRRVGDVERVNGSIRLAVLAYSHLFNNGIGPVKGDDPSKWSPFDVVAKILAPSRIGKLGTKAIDAATTTNGDLKGIIEGKDDNSDDYLFSSLVFELNQPWKRTDLYRNHEPSNQLHVFHQIIRHGIERGLRVQLSNAAGDLPSARIDCPYAKFGKIKLILDDEIQQYSNCRRIIVNYLNNRDWRKPLSIAVFGKPGIGKSFAVQQLVKMNPSDDDEIPLVFNLAQFDSLDQLTQAFHTIQSAVLASEDRPPLIMFDEFDADFDTPLGWLKYFLAPMQDGEFRGRNGTYKIGRAIFAFADATSHRFEEFQKAAPTRKLGSDVGSEHPDSFRKSVKLPDFVSRLHGHLDLADLGVVQLDHRKLLKRAMLIRTFLEQHTKSIFSGDEKKPSIANIDDDVIEYFLTRPDYPFGTRSLETIIRGSTPINHRFVMASLPPDEQINHHGGSRKLTRKEAVPAPAGPAVTNYGRTT